MRSRRLLRLGACASFLAALQPWALLVIGDVDTSSLAVLVTQPSANWRLGLWLMLLAMPPMFLAYLIAALSCWRQRPIVLTIAIGAFFLWFVLELTVRSVDLFAVAGRWAPAYLSAAPPDRQFLEQAYRIYGDIVYSLAFVRRHALLLGQLLLAVVVSRPGVWSRVLAAALALSVLRLILGTLSTYFGYRLLGTIADPLYFVTAGVLFPVMGFWLLRQAKSFGASTEPAGA